MLFTTFRYKYYQLLTRLALKKKKSTYNNNMLVGESLAALKQKFQQPTNTSLQTNKSLSTKQFPAGRTLPSVFKRFGKPAFIKTTQIGEITHDVVLYKRIINGLRSKIIYNFVNKKVAAITFRIQAETDLEQDRVNDFIMKTYAPEGLDSLKHFACFVDADGHKFIYQNIFTISISFLNNDPEIIENINQALYQDKQKVESNPHRNRFELSF